MAVIAPISGRIGRLVTAGPARRWSLLSLGASVAQAANQPITPPNRAART
jgi:hypothetical protein